MNTLKKIIGAIIMVISIVAIVTFGDRAILEIAKDVMGRNGDIIALMFLFLGGLALYAWLFNID